MNEPLLVEIRESLDRFVPWLERFGETSQDQQDFYAGNVGRMAKALYYRRKRLGAFAVMPMVFCEAFVPSARRFFHPRMRLPIADAHYAMGFALLFRATGKREHYEKAVHFLDVLKQTRCPGYRFACWGYPFDWQTRYGVIKAGTPLVTTVPYCYEAFEYVYRIDRKDEWRDMLRSIAEHTLLDYKDVPVGAEAATCTYTPLGGSGVVNASAYRSFVLASAAREFSDDRFSAAAAHNLNFVLQSQKADGSWPYSVDGARDFVDHFHTCFVLKGIAKVEKITGHSGCQRALQKGLEYYLMNLFDDNGLPRPFSRAPRMTVYKRELYDYAECLNLGMLLRGSFPSMEQTIERVAVDLFEHWTKRDGSFRSRKLFLGYDNVPMHRWGQSQIFRSLSLILSGGMGSEIFAAK
jgi:hypothetical protein